MNKLTRRSALPLGIGFVSGALSGVAEAAIGSIYLKIVSGGFIVGAGGDSGVLTFRGMGYPLRLGGVSLGATIGLSETELVGTAYHLQVPREGLRLLR